MRRVAIAPPSRPVRPEGSRCHGHERLLARVAGSRAPRRRAGEGRTRSVGPNGTSTAPAVARRARPGADRPRASDRRPAREGTRGAGERGELAANETAGAVERARGARPLRRRAVSSAAGRFDQERVARAHRDPDLFGFQDAVRSSTRAKAVAVRTAVLAAEEAVRWVTRTVARGVGDGRLL